MEPAAVSGTIIALIVGIIVLILLVLAILMPAFVYEIRKGVLSIDKKLDRIIQEITKTTPPNNPGAEAKDARQEEPVRKKPKKKVKPKKPLKPTLEDTSYWD